VAYQPIKRQEVLSHETIKVIADKYNASAAQVALAWLLTKGVLPIPKAVNKQHIDENIAATELHLSDEDVALLDNI
jgi:diketogulonate reductase-like aldo/keto reductase